MAAVSLPDPSPTHAALVTGASAGIGKAIAAELAERGHNLVLVARRKPQLDELAAELSERFGIRAETLACDLAKPSARGRLAGQVEELGLEISVLVNNAGFATGGPFHQADPERELQQVRLLVEAVVALTSAFAPGMADRRSGAILNIASTAGMQPMPFSAGYSAAKAYVLAFSEALHYELRPRGVTVTALAPGPVRTDFWEIANWETSSGGKFEDTVGRPAMITAEAAARAAVEGVEHGRRVVVPGLPVRAAMEATRFLPHAVKLPAIAWMMGRREG
jgi:short-subunit dehydrogenase